MLYDYLGARGFAPVGRKQLKSLSNKVSNRLYLATRRLDHIHVPGGLVSFTFDDFPESALHVGGEILEDAGWRGTYYVASHMLGRVSDCGRIASRADVEDCFRRGHEIANHTCTHLNCLGVESRRLRLEVEKNSAALGIASRNFSFPFGLGDIREMRIIRDLVTTARGNQRGFNAEKTAPQSQPNILGVRDGIFVRLV
jgi:peptidoglycan/xylan/chitin deacetylase (PgdA/CDA1 family)